ncbi:MAG: TIGR04086 family membrane protein [Bdellovibrionota bacterium]
MGFVDKAKSLSPRGILLGTAVDLGGSLAAGVLLFLEFTVASNIQDPKSIQVLFFSKTSNLIASLCSGFLFTFLGGFVAGKVAKKSELLNGAASSIVCFLLSFAISLGHESPTPSWYNWTCYFLTLPVAVLGGYFAFRHNRMAITEKARKLTRWGIVGFVGVLITCIFSMFVLAVRQAVLAKMDSGPLVPFQVCAEVGDTKLKAQQSIAGVTELHTYVGFTVDGQFCVFSERGESWMSVQKRERFIIFGKKNRAKCIVARIGEKC